MFHLCHYSCCFDAVHKLKNTVKKYFEKNRKKKNNEQHKMWQVKQNCSTIVYLIYHLYRKLYSFQKNLSR